MEINSKTNKNKNRQNSYCYKSDKRIDMKQELWVGHCNLRHYVLSLSRLDYDWVHICYSASFQHTGFHICLLLAIVISMGQWNSGIDVLPDVIL